MTTNPWEPREEARKSHAGLSMTKEQREDFNAMKAWYELPSDSAVLKLGLTLLHEKWVDELKAQK